MEDRLKNTDFNELVARVYENAKAHGFHDVEYEDGHWFMLVVCELAEAVEADRADRRADRKEFERLAGACEDIVWPHLFEMYIKDSVEDELADAVIRLFDYMGMKDDGAVQLFDRMAKEWIDDDDKMDVRQKGFPEKVWDIVNMFCFDGIVEYAAGDVFRLAKECGIDLLWHIEQKMKYNETRAMMHGKKY